ncbi:MAG: DUF502 domain-containing protein [Planctomycetota bacterium]|nr:DUF502 domain-containing protein [Planctomycetota bacterium]
MSLGKSIRRTFWKGLAALLPALLTIIVLSFGLSLVYSYGGEQVNSIIIALTAWARGMDPADVRTWYENHWLQWVGVVVAVVGLCALAYLVGTFLGARFVRFIERSLMRLPLAKNIYPGAKQVSEFFFSERKVDFSRVVAIEFPRKGMWMAGFVTGKGFQALSRKSGQELLSVFVPFSPVPVTGYTVMVSKEDVVDLPITVDEAFQYMLSAGVIMPQAERPQLLQGMAEPPAPTVPGKNDL